jgi:hypothetical protein
MLIYVNAESKAWFTNLGVDDSDCLAFDLRSREISSVRTHFCDREARRTLPSTFYTGIPNVPSAQIVHILQKKAFCFRRFHRARLCQGRIRP